MVSALPINKDYVANIIVDVVFTFLSGVTIVLRYLSRRRGTTEWKADDWTIVTAWVFALGYMVANLYFAIYAMAGYPAKEVDLPHLQAYEKVRLDNSSIMLSKVSILLMYRRIFPTPKFKFWTLPLFGLIAGYWIVAVILEVYGYSPVFGQWNPDTPPTLVNELSFGLAMAGINMTIDVLILVMPQVKVWKLQMSTQRKLLVGGVFVFGAMVCLASIIRFVYFARINFTDPTITLTNAGIWTSLEANIAIICACLPTLAAIFKHWFGSQREKRPLPITTSLRNRMVFGRATPRSGESHSRLYSRESSLASAVPTQTHNEHLVTTYSITPGESQKQAQPTEMQTRVGVQRDFDENEDERLGEV